MCGAFGAGTQGPFFFVGVVGLIGLWLTPLQFFAPNSCRFTFSSASCMFPGGGSKRRGYPQTMIAFEMVYCYLWACSAYPDLRFGLTFDH